jgi:hypothetical protein
MDFLRKLFGKSGGLNEKRKEAGGRTSSEQTELKLNYFDGETLGLNCPKCSSELRVSSIAQEHRKTGLQVSCSNCREVTLIPAKLLKSVRLPEFSSNLSSLGVGDVYLIDLSPYAKNFPFAKNLFGALRVIRKGDSARNPANRFMMNIESGLLVAVTPWVGTQAPNLNEPLLRKVLLRNHHAWKDEPAMQWAGSEVPSGLSKNLLGRIPPTSDELRLTSNDSGGWNMELDLLYQLDWDRGNRGDPFQRTT